VGPLGFTLTKQEWIQRHRSDDLAYQTLAWQAPSVCRYGDAAIVIAAQTQTATCRGTQVAGRFRVTQVAVGRDGR
jgi:hypothetical protein